MNASRFMDRSGFESEFSDVIAEIDFGDDLMDPNEVSDVEAERFQQILKRIRMEREVEAEKRKEMVWIVDDEV